MSSTERHARGRRPLRLLVALLATGFLAVGASAYLIESSATPASAAPAIAQCNGINNTPGLTTNCSVTVVNTLTDDPATSGSVTTMNGVTTTSTDIVLSVTQCNTSSRGGGGTLRCSVNITNNIAMSGAGAAQTASISQCTGNQPDGLGTAPHTCNPVANTGSGATIFQCNNRTGNGGGLVTAAEFSHCSASGTVSASLPVRVNQCNEDAADGGGARVSCTTSITTNVVDTGVPTGDTTGGGPIGDIPGSPTGDIPGSPGSPNGPPSEDTSTFFGFGPPTESGPPTQSGPPTAVFGPPNLTG